MTLDDAIATFRRLEAEAAEGWPYEYDFHQVLGGTHEALAAIDAHVKAAEDSYQEAKAIRHRIERTEAFAATVPTKRERARQGAR